MATVASTPREEEILRRAVMNHQAGQVEAAEQDYRQLLSLAPDHAEGRHMLGILAYQTGRADMAIALVESAAALQPDTVEYQNNLGNMLRDAGRADTAVAVYRKALAIVPNHAELRANLAKTLVLQEQYDEAEAEFRRALQVDPGHVEALNDLGNLLCDAERYDEAIDCYTAVLRVRPGDVRAHNNLGRALGAQARYPEAVQHLQAALRLHPGYVNAWFNFGKLLTAQGRWDEADACWRKVLALTPDDAEAHVARANMLLSIGRLEEGWPELRWQRELRRQNPDELGVVFPAPTWRGEDIGSDALVLYADQGLGDSIQFCRYVPLCAQRARVFLVVPPALFRLFRQFDDVADVLSEPRLPDGYLHCPLTALPGIFQTGLHNIPATVPYLHADPARVAVWRRRLAHLPGLRVGVVWAGNPRYPADRHRSMALQPLVEALNLPDVSLVSLQKGGSAAKIALLPSPGSLRDPMDQVVDFADTAALITVLDLVIGVDTSVIHMAGALGKPVWLLNRFDADWRWLRDRDDSPWYPTLRQFRQSVSGEWQDPLRRARRALQAVLAEQPSAAEPADRLSLI